MSETIYKDCARALLKMTHRDLLALAEHINEYVAEERRLQHAIGPVEIADSLLTWADAVVLDGLEPPSAPPHPA